MAGESEEHGERAAVAAVFLFVAAFVLYHYAFEYFVYVWKFFVIPILAGLKYLPSFLTNIIFFWTGHSVKESADVFFNGTLNYSATYFAANKDKLDIVNNFLGYLLSPYVIIILLWCSYKIYAKKIFKDKYSVNSLAIAQSKRWAQIKPIVYDHPEREPDLNKGKWAMGLRAEVFVQKHELLNHYENEIGDLRFSLNEEKSYKVFLSQMGRKWTSVDDLSIEERQIYALFITKACRKTEDAQKLIDLLANAYTSQKFFFLFDKIIKRRLMKKANKQVEISIKKYSDKENVKKCINSYFYVKTVLSALLEEARKDGVLAPADFLWLKYQNRSLWYMLNNIGRKSSWVECSGPWSHYLMEKLLERKVANPTIDNAVKALDEYLEYCSDEYDPLVVEEENDDSEI